MPKVWCANWVCHVAAQGTPSDAGTSLRQMLWVERNVVPQVEIVLCVACFVSRFGKAFQFWLEASPFSSHSHNFVLEKA